MAFMISSLLRYATGSIDVSFPYTLPSVSPNLADGSSSSSSSSASSDSSAPPIAGISTNGLSSSASSAASQNRPWASSVHPLFTIHPTTNTTTAETFSLFVFDKQRHAHDPSLLQCAKHACTKLKILRFPYVLKYVDSYESSTHFFIVTEEVRPFGVEYHRGDTASELQLSLILFQLSSALSWLNNDCKLVHGAICPWSVYLTKSNEPRLFGFEVTLKHAEAPPSHLTVAHRSMFLPPAYRCPEHVKATSMTFFTELESAMVPVPPHYLDAWSFGCFIFDCFANGSLTSPQQLQNKDLVHASMQSEYKRLLATNPSARLNPKVLLESKFVQNELVKGITFLENFTLRSNEEKDVFFLAFSKSLTEFPEPVCKYKVLPQLLNILSFGPTMSCFPNVLASVLRISRTLSSADFEQSVAPAVVKLFSSNERAVRVHLLQNIDQYAHHLSADLINASVFEHVLTGFADAAPLLRELTVKSVPHFAPKLSATHIENALRHLSRLQADPEPAIRTNTAYCIAKMAASLTPVTREKVLAAAFGRAMRDPFPPARIAGLVSVQATMPYHSPLDCARKLIPVVSPLCIDDVPDVRESAMRLMGVMMQKLTQYSTGEMGLTQVDSSTTAGGASGASGGASGGTGGAASAAAALQAGDAAAVATAIIGNISSWAVSSFAAKLIGPAGAGGAGGTGSGVASPVQQVTSISSAANSASAAKPAGTKSAGLPSVPALPQQQQQQQQQQQLPVKPVVPSAASSSASSSSSEGWDDDFFGDSSSSAEPEPTLMLSTTKKKTKDASGGAASAAKSSLSSSSRRTASSSQGGVLATAASSDDLSSAFGEPLSFGGGGAGAALSSSPAPARDLSSWDVDFDPSSASASASSASTRTDTSSFDPLSSSKSPTNANKASTVSMSSSSRSVSTDLGFGGLSLSTAKSSSVAPASLAASTSSRPPPPKKPSSSSILLPAPPSASSTMTTTSTAKKSNSNNLDDWSSFLDS